MSTENVKKFLELIKIDESLSRALTKLTSSVRADIKQCNEKEVIAKYILPVAKEYGLDFTIDEFTAVVDSEIKKLSKNELLAVSGGKTFRAPALGLLLASVLAFAHSSGDNSLNIPVFEKVAEAAGLPEEIENSIIVTIKEHLENAGINISKKDDVEILAKITRKVVCYTLETNAIEFTEDEDIPNLFHCTDEDGENFDVSVANLIEMALETPDDIKVDIIEEIRRRAKGKKLSQPLTFDRFIEEIRFAVYNSLYHSDLSPVPEQGDKFLFHCKRNETKFNVDTAKLIEEALGPSM